MKFIEIKDVENNTCIIPTDKIICIREKRGASAVYILCNDVDVITYESIESIIDKIKK